MKAATLDFEIEQGATFERTLRYLNPIYKMTVVSVDKGTDSGAIEPTWPETKFNKVSDGDLVWQNTGQASQKDMDSYGTWQASMSYALEEVVLTAQNPVDLTGYKARMHVRPNIASTTLIAALTTENGGISIDGTQGEVTLTIQAGETELFDAYSRAVYDLELVSAPRAGYPDGFVTRIIQGKVKFLKEVTRPAGLNEISITVEIEVV